MKFEEPKTIRLTRSNFHNQNDKSVDSRIVTLPDLESIFNESTFFDLKKSDQKYNIKRNPQSFPLNRLLKRLFDVFFSLLAILLVGSWLFPLVAILILIDSRGSVFYVQKRSGINNSVFNCIKFRTMKFEESASFKAATKNDSRITKLGSFLRKSSVDELPQLINVFFGQMSLVGPRPHAIETDLEYKKMVAKYDYRLAVKPGITGLAQAKGYRGETFKPRDMSNRIRIDIFYIENWTFRLDIKIILLTLNSMLLGDKNAY